MSDWRSNPTLVECFDNCVAMFRCIAAKPIVSRDIRGRRQALGLSQSALASAAGYRRSDYVSRAEKGEVTTVGRICAALDRLEAERRQLADAIEGH